MSQHFDKLVCDTVPILSQGYEKCKIKNSLYGIIEIWLMATLGVRLEEGGNDESTPKSIFKILHLIH